jgi:glycosyltransferase involved in cell wall biosynthesis
MTVTPRPDDSAVGLATGLGTEQVPVTTTYVSIVIPCLNEAASIGDCVLGARRALQAAGLDGEVVVADNGSTDGSRALARSNGARVVSVGTRGYGSAVRGGIEAATGEFILLADADGQHDFADVGLFIDKLHEGFDVVVGNRFKGSSLDGAMTWTHRYIGNPILSGLVRVLFHPKVGDAQCGMRALTRTAYVAMDLRTTGFELCPEMVVKAAHHHLNITEIPITVLPDRRDRPPHLRTIPDGWRHLTFILMCSPVWLFVVPGMILLAFGISIVSWLALGSQSIGTVMFDTRTELFGVILASLGLCIVCIGAFARVFSYSDPARSRSLSIGRFLRMLKLEQGLAVGALLVVAGLVGNLIVIAPGCCTVPVTSRGSGSSSSAPSG